MFSLFAAQDRFISFGDPFTPPFNPPPLITDAAPLLVVPNVQSFEFTAQIAPTTGFGVQFADPTPQEVTVTGSFPFPVDIGLAFSRPDPFGFFGRPVATFDGFLLF